MKRILLIIIIIMVAKSCLSQQAYGTPVYNSWQTSNSYIIGTSAAALATLFAIATENPIEITPQVGPSINWLTPNQELSQFMQTHGTTTGPLYGYSAGAMIGLPRNRMVYKSGIFFESKGGTYSNNSDIVQTDNMGNPTIVKANTTGYSRLNYLTIPLTIGAQTKGRIRIGIDVGGFVSLPVGETHRSTTNGFTADFEPLSKIGTNIGFITNAGAKIPINDRMDLSVDARLLSSFSKTMEQIGKSFNQGVQVLVGINMRLNK
jgi:hypothetical protein